MTRKTKKTEKKKTAKAVPQSGMSRASAASSKTKVATKAPRRGTEPAAAPRHDPAGAGSPVKGPGRSRAARKAAAVNASAVRQADPFYARELAQYDHPLPSREYVLQVLAERGVPLSFADLVAALDVAPHELDFFDRRLRAMERDGQIIRNRRDAYLLPAKVDLIKGRVEGHPDGFGFLRRDDGEPDIFLGPKEMRELLHGDRVIVRIAGQDRRGRPEGKLVEVLERANKRVVGRVINEHGVMIVVPENRRLAQDILVAPGGRKKPEAGQIVTVELVEQPTKFAQPIGRIVDAMPADVERLPIAGKVGHERVQRVELSAHRCPHPAPDVATVQQHHTLGVVRPLDVDMQRAHRSRAAPMPCRKASSTANSAQSRYPSALG